MELTCAADSHASVAAPNHDQLALSQLETCDYRVSTAQHGVYFCRHRRVHTERHLVNSAICRDCVLRHQSCVPLPVPKDPLEATRQTNKPERLEYISTEKMVGDVRALATRLPDDIVAVAGIPRSGMIPASILAALLHVPLYEVVADAGVRAIGHGQRLKDTPSACGTALIVDDSVHSGAAMKAARQSLEKCCKAWKVMFAAIYPRPETLSLLDAYACLCPAPHLFEWNLFNCIETQRFAFDMDGVICHDWPGGREDGEDYLEFLRGAQPRWLPRRAAVPLIVTARLEKYRKPTLEWLRRYGVRVKQLVMGPWVSATERRREYDAGAFKGQAYANSRCTLFIESDEQQAEAIFHEANRPVLCPATGRIFQ